MSTEVRAVNYRELMKKVEQVVSAIDRSDDVSSTIQTVIETIIQKFRGELGIYGGRLYRLEGNMYVLERRFGDAAPVDLGLKIPWSYPPFERLAEEGVVYMATSDPGVDPELEAKLGVQRFAAVEVGDEDFVLAFDIAQGVSADDVRFSLGILRHSINEKIRRERMRTLYEEARKIQASILPRRVPTYGQFDLFGRFEPMESVGGDFFDYIPLTEKILGLAIADVSGHGLTAALQVRDIYMGLRMGLARDLKIVRTVERLNSIIHRSTLTSRFVSMFYGELELNGNFIYVNAGHPPPFHLSADGTCRLLEEGGPVLGPLASASYERGFVIMKPGDMLVFYTDGIVEALGKGDGADREEYGLRRLIQVASAQRGKPAQEVVEGVFQDVERFSEGEPAQDDRTVMVVCQPATGTPTMAFPRPRFV